MITHGSVTVLSYLHGGDAICSDLAYGTGLAESSAYRWLTELEAEGILDAEATHANSGRPVTEYHLPDEELGAAARVLVDRLTDDTSRQ